MNVGSLKLFSRSLNPRHHRKHLGDRPHHHRKIRNVPCNPGNLCLQYLQARIRCANLRQQRLKRRRVRMNMKRIVRRKKPPDIVLAVIERGKHIEVGRAFNRRLILGIYILIRRPDIG